ncbi:hypothetical protein HK096_002640 [Nowakowskiella sp. JEL0078]|nr:hypothetical protein HK096_002640 [Nowakowskiella sp. JEL0078]
MVGTSKHKLLKVNFELDNTEAKDFGKEAKSFIGGFPSHAKNYLISLFPIATWITRYNLNWFTGDIIAAITVGFLILPQALAQAKIATLPAEYGLYTGFVGLLVYAWFATSKDATIGPTAVLSLLTSQLLVSANTDSAGNDIYPKATFAITLTFFAGIYQLIIGFFRIGFLANFIPATVIDGFTTGACITIIIQQLPSLLGVTGIETNKQAIYLALRDLVINLYRAKIDALLGLTALAFLIGLKVLKETVGTRQKWAFWLGVSRNGIILVLYLLISFIVSKAYPGQTVFNIVGTIPAGFKTPTKPNLDAGIVQRAVVPALTATLIGIIEHVGIIKAFGRKFGYTRNINASQEIIALGLTNFLGSFLSAYPATGSFSRSAVKAASGVRTPLAGIFTSVIVVIGLYGLTGVFYFIPNAVLAAIIIGAMTELIAPFRVWVEFWNISFFDFLVFFVAVFTTIFLGIETGIYSSVALAAFIILLRLARPKVLALARNENSQYDVVEPDQLNVTDGILAIRFSESIEYPNSAFVGSKVLEFVTDHTVYGGTPRKASERLWFDDTEEKAKRQRKKFEFIDVKEEENTEKAILEKAETGEVGEVNTKGSVLRAIVFDFSAVNEFDQAGFNLFRENREEIAKFAGRPVYFYFVGAKPKIQRNLLRLIRHKYTPETLSLLLPRISDESLLLQPSEDEEVFFLTVEDATKAALSGTERVSVALVKA